jgi:hypothetical protein
MKTVFVVAALIAMCVAGVWAWMSPGWDAYAGLTVAVATLAGALLVPGKSPDRLTMRQQVGNDSIAIQSAGDTHIGGVVSRDNSSDV